MSKLLSKENILAAKDIQTIDVEVPEWGGTVRVSEISAGDRCRLQAMIFGDDDKPKSAEEISEIMTIRLCAMACVDENGEKIFSMDDVAALAKKSSKAINRIFDAADKLNGISVRAEEQIRKK